MPPEFFDISQDLADWLDHRTGARAVNRVATPWANRATVFAPVRPPLEAPGDDGQADG